MPKFESGMENMADMFVFETGDLLEKLDEILMRTEQEDSISSDDINEIFRTMHTIKGSAAMMSMHNMSTLAHSVEDLFYIIREDPTVKYDKPALYELLFSASDNLKSELDSLYDDAPLTDFSELENKIHAFAATMKGQPATDSSDTSSADTDTYEGLFPDDEKEGVLTYKITYSESCAMPDMRALVLLRALGKMCEVIKTFPEDLDADNAGDEISQKGLYIKLITDNPNGVLDLMKNAVNVDKAEQVKKPEQPANAAKKTSACPKACSGKVSPKACSACKCSPQKSLPKSMSSP
ncbi:MAG: Hpt domain-containing protein [Ruminococcus sp.]